MVHASKTREAVSTSPRTSNETTPPKRICFFAMLWPAWLVARQPRVVDRVHARVRGEEFRRMRVVILGLHRERKRLQPRARAGTRRTGWRSAGRVLERADVADEVEHRAAHFQ